MRPSLVPLLRPQSVAVIGASDTPSRLGGRPIHSMKQVGYKGRIYPVNPNRETVQGLTAYPSIKDLPEAVDCAIIAVPARIALDAARDCAELGAKSAIVFTSGFAEVGGDQVEQQAELTAIARDSGMRIVGPNCLGIFNIEHKWYGTFVSQEGLTGTKTGATAIISQSGAYGSHMFQALQLRGVGATNWVTTGNECDVDVAAVIEHFAGDPDVKVIAAYAEGMQDCEAIHRALAAARDAEKPVIFTKVGTTDVGARAAASHTASLAGADAIYDALFRHYGVYRAHTTEEMVDVAYACQFGHYPTGRDLGLQTISGGVGVLMADAAEEFGLDVPPVPEATQKKLKDIIPFAGVTNPVDFTAQALNDPEVMKKNIRLTIDEAGYDILVIYMASVPWTPFTRQICKDIFSEIRQAYPDETIVLSLLGWPELLPPYEEMGYPCFMDPTLAVRAAAALCHFGEIFARGRPDAPPAPPAGMLAAPKETVAEHEAKRVLASAGIPVVREALAASADEAVAAWQQFNGPVVMKIASPDIAHKTEIGGIALNLNDADAVAAAHGTLIERAKTARPDARLDGIIVADMVPGGVETVIGVVRDPLFGPAVMFGLGGIFVEVLKDVAFRLAPFGIDEAHRMIDQIKGRKVLDGVRGGPPADIDALAEALARLSVFAAENADAIDSIDINPFLVLPEGAVAVDALIVPAADDEI